MLDLWKKEEETKKRSSSMQWEVSIQAGNAIVTKHYAFPAFGHQDAVLTDIYRNEARHAKVKVLRIKLVPAK